MCLSARVLVATTLPSPPCLSPRSRLYTSPFRRTHPQFPSPFCPTQRRRPGLHTSAKLTHRVVPTNRVEHWVFASAYSAAPGLSFSLGSVQPSAAVLASIPAQSSPIASNIGFSRASLPALSVVHATFSAHRPAGEVIYPALQHYARPAPPSKKPGGDL
ncbi:hypothetical protein B0H15DRAFT_833234 [Mycena belliarum]|uniref:Uncharacterized protein n=1 Tax=Mycena belliarum TaxID=1033014 RepID=A0AAD6UAZ2_9AGAR|nr:hypothetical protein B0H15DRAFT_833234 [Mycena belliae]